jgi:inner membrane protein
MQIKLGNSQKNTLFPKLVAIGFITVVSCVASFLILPLTIERSNRANGAVDAIGTQWAREQTLGGPIITIPTKSIRTYGEQQIVDESFVFLLPDELKYDVSLETEVRSRGIFDAAVYTAHVKGSGTINTNMVNTGDTMETAQWENAQLSINIPDMRGLESSGDLSWDGQKIAFAPSTASPSIGTSGMSAPIHISQDKKDYTFNFDIVLRGSKSISFIPLGKTTDVSITSNWTSPNFSGEFLPKDRAVSNTGFTANWIVSSFGRPIPQSWSGATTADTNMIQENMQKSAFGVTLHQNVDFYTQVNRAVKYSILFISLTFLTFFLFEILSKLRIHPLNYLLVGFAIALFYLLLLSLSEHIGFLSAYTVSTLATISLIAGYCRSVLKTKKRAGIIVALLLALYVYLYILLQLDELSLVVGSVVLFTILTSVMYLTRNIDWYEVSKSE